MARYYWLKLMDSFFGETYIKAMRAMPKGDSMVNAYLEMALHSLKTGGVIEYKGFMPTITEELAVAVSEPASLIKKTLDTLNKFGVVVIGEDKSAVFVEVVNNICSETPVAQRVRDSRKRKAQQALQGNGSETEKALQCNADVMEELPHRNTEIDIEKEKELELEKDTDTPLPPFGGACDFAEIINQFNSICVSLNKAGSLTGTRKKAIQSAVSAVGLEKLVELFRKAEASDFLTKRNSTGWKAGFDWLMKPENYTKVLEGNYDNRKPAKPPEPAQTDYTSGGKYQNVLNMTGDIDPDDYPF